MTLFWSLAGDEISFAVRGERKSGYVTIAFGRSDGIVNYISNVLVSCEDPSVWLMLPHLLLCCSGMVNSFAYVGWIDDEDVGRVDTYWIDGKEASKIHTTSETLTAKKCSREDGRITFEFTRLLVPACVKGAECKNVIDPTDVLKVVWAMGPQWSNGKSE